MDLSDRDMHDDIRDIDALLDAFSQAIITGDITALPPLFCEGATAYFSGSSGLIRGRGALVKTWQKHMAQWSDVTIKRRDTLVRIHGDVAWAHFLWDGEGTASGARYRLESERWSVVFLWEEGTWRFAQMHTSMPYQDWEAHRV